MAHVPHDDVEVTLASRAVPGATVQMAGLTVSLVGEADVPALLVGSTGRGQALSLVLPADVGAVAGLSVFTRLGRVYACHWALVWGAGPAPETGVDFSSGDLRFRRETRSAAVAVGPAWLAAAEGVFREATVDPDGLAPHWLALRQSS